MRAHNVNVRSFILRSAAAATGRERTGRRRVKKKKRKRKTKKPSQKYTHNKRATGNKPCTRTVFIYALLYVNDERNTHWHIVQ